MSTLYVDDIVEKTSNHGVQIPGHIVQVTRTYLASQSGYISTASTSFAASGIIATLTPAKAGNIILVDLCISMADAAAADTLNIRMYQSIGGASYTGMAGSADYQCGIQSAIRWTPQVFQGKYTTTNTSSVAFQPYFKSSAGGTVRLVHDSSAYGLTLTEIAQ